MQLSLFTRLVIGSIFISALPCAAWSQSARVFMALDGAQYDQPMTGPTTVTMNPGETVTVMVWMEDLAVDSQLLYAYQLLLPWAPEPLAGSSGAVFYQDNDPGQGGGDSIYLDLNRPDWIFAGTPPLPPTFNETPHDQFFGVFYSTIYKTGINPDDLGIRYLVQFRFTASLDACGRFEARTRLAPKAPPLSALFTTDGTSFGDTDYQKLLIDVINCDEPCEEPCDDADACTVDDQWCGDVCAGQPAVCPIEDCLARSCDPAGAEGNCATDTSINEGLWCNDLHGLCLQGTCVEPSAEHARSFMAPEALHDTTPQFGPTYYSMMPGDTVRIMTWVEALIPDEPIRISDLWWPYVASPALDATGTVTYVDGPGDGNSVTIDRSRADWLFADLPQSTPEYFDSAKDNYFRATYVTPPGAAIDPGETGEIRYLAEFELTASPDASGTFELALLELGGLVKTSGGPYFVNERQPLVIFVGAPQPLVSVPPHGSTDPSGGPDIAGNHVGRDHIILYLNGPADALAADDFNIASTGAVTPAIERIVAEDTTATVYFDQPIPAGHCTLIVHVPSGWFAKLRALPGDIDGNSLSSTDDVLALVDHLAGVLAEPLADWQCDIDQSGVCNGLDILAEIDLLNGAGGGMAWNGVEVPECP